MGLRAVLSLFVLLPWAQGCKPQATKPLDRKSQDEKSLDKKWAQGFSLEVREGITHLTVFHPWKDAAAPLRYALVPIGTPAVPDSGEIMLRVPARRIACLTTVHLGFLEALGLTGSVVAVAEARQVYDSSLRAALSAGQVVEVRSGSQLDVERLFTARPDLVLANTIGPEEYPALQRLQAAGIPVMVTSEWLEKHPLARAEWIRVLGALTGKSARADSLFASVASSYQALAQQVGKPSRRPTVMVGAPFRDAWFVPGGRSFMARFIADAGADYLWNMDSATGGVPLSLEAVLHRAHDADFWLDPSDWRNLSEGLRQDARLAQFSAFQRDAVYNNNARVAGGGGNDYWESAVANPQKVLSDLVLLFHPESFPAESGLPPLTYYRHLAPPIP